MLLLAAGLAVAVGALLQGAAGLGMALVAAPLLALIDPRFVPVPLLAIGGLHSVLALRREHPHTDWSGVRWALLGRLPGIGLGVLAVATLPPRPFLAFVAVVVLVSAALTSLRTAPQPTPRALVAAGLVSGVGGTAASISGPPIALLYQHAGGPRVRGTLSAYYTVGAALSLAALAVAGEVDAVALRDAALLAPFMLVGFALSGRVRQVLDRAGTRAAVVTLSCAAAVVLLVSALVG